MEYYQTEVYLPFEGRWKSVGSMGRSGDMIVIIPSNKLTNAEAYQNRKQLEKDYSGYDFRVSPFDYSTGND